MPGCAEPVAAVIMTASRRGSCIAATDAPPIRAARSHGPASVFPPRTGWAIHRRLPDHERARPQKGPEHDNVCDNGSASKLAANSRAAKAPSLSRFHAVDE
jgi:hypothetical protein